MSEEPDARELHMTKMKLKQLWDELHKIRKDISKAVDISKTVDMNKAVDTRENQKIYTPIYPELFQAHNHIISAITEVDTLIAELKKTNSESAE